MESHRLGVHIVSPAQIFHSQGSCGTPQGPFPSVKQAATLVFGDNTGKLLNVGGYVSGWFDCFDIKGANNDIGGVVGIMEAYDAAHANSMAQLLALSSTGATSKSTTLPNLPKAYVGVYPTEDGNSAVNGLMVTGRMVAYVNMDTGTAKTGGAGRLDTVRGMAGNVLRQQVAKLQTFTPTPVDKLGKLDDDPQQLDAKTAQPDGNPGWSDGGYSLETYPEVSDSPSELPVLKAAGMTEAYLRSGYPEGHNPTGGVSLYQLRDAKSAKTVWSFFLHLANSDSPKPTGLPLPKKKQRKGAPTVPKNITCLLSHPGTDADSFRQDCYVLAGRYVAQVDLYWSADLASAAHSRSKDSSRVLTLVNKQLALTPQ